MFQLKTLTRIERLSTSKRLEEPNIHPQASKNVDDQKPTASTSLKEHSQHESHPDSPF
jgi:hypothetical protein